jgi:hypothetical protein
MPSREELEKYRSMTVNERLALTLKLSEEKLPLLLKGSPEDVARRFELLRRYRDEGHRRVLERLARVSGKTVESTEDEWDSSVEMREDDPIVREIEEWL